MSRPLSRPYARRLLTLGTLALGLLTLATPTASAQPETRTEQQLLESPDPEVEVRFGVALARSGDLLAVAARADGDGAVYIYELQEVCKRGGCSSEWVFFSLIEPEDDGEEFGNSLALIGDGLGGSGRTLLVVGAPEAARSGAVYLYELQGEGRSGVRGGESPWQLIETLLPEEDSKAGGGYQEFGRSVAIGSPNSGGGSRLSRDFRFADHYRVVVGAPEDNDGEGAVYVFENSGGGIRRGGENWDQTARLTVRSGIEFGYAVALSEVPSSTEARLLIGSPGSDEAYVFETYSDARLEGVGGTGWDEVDQLYGGGDFGYSVALDGDLALVGAPDDDRAYLFQDEGRDVAGLAGGRWQLLQTLDPDDGDSRPSRAAARGGGPEFGKAVSLEGLAVVGAPYAFGDEGAVFVYTPDEALTERRQRFGGDEGGFTLTDILVADDPDESLGRSVLLAGTQIFAGAPFESGDDGAVYVFDSGAQPPLPPGDPQLGADINGEAMSDNFGASVSVSGNRVAIGAPNGLFDRPLAQKGIDGVNESFSGYTRVFEWSGSAWVQLGDDIDGENAGDRSGTSVSLDGNRLAIGTPLNDGNGQNSGHTRVFEWSGSAWVQLGQDIDGEAEGDESGYSVSLDGNRLAIGAPHNDGNNGNALGFGHTRVFEWSGSVWSQVGPDIDGENANDQSGFSVSLVGDRLAIGAPQNDDNGDRSGHTRIFEWSGSAWVQLGRDIDGEAEEEYSGSSVSVSGDRVAIGAPQNGGNGEGEQVGKARIFEWSGSAWVQLGQDIIGDRSYDRLGSSVSLERDRLAVVAPQNRDGIGYVRMVEWTGSTWIQATADYTAEIRGDGGSTVVSLSGGLLAVGSPEYSDVAQEAGYVRVFGSVEPQILITLTGGEGWRTLALPYDDLPLGSRIPGFLSPMWTAGYGGATRDPRNQRGLANVFFHDEPTGEFIPPPNQWSVDPGQGLWVYVHADEDDRTPGVQGGFPKTLRPAGTRVTGPVSLPVTYTASAPASPGPGVNLVGNPYDEAIDWDDPNWTKTNIGGTVYVWDQTLNAPDGDFRTWNGTGDLEGGLIPAGQGFHVIADGPDPVLVVTESAKTGSTGQVYGKSASAPAGVAFRLAGTVGGSERQSAAWVTLNANATLGVDAADGRRLAGRPGGDALRLYTLVPDGLPSEGSALAISSVPSGLGGPVEIPLHAEALADGSATDARATLSWDATALSDGWSAALYDRESGAVYDLAIPGEVPLVLSAETAKTVTEADQIPAWQKSDNPLVPLLPPRARPLRAEGPARFAVVLTPGVTTKTSDVLALAVSEVGPNPAVTTAEIGVQLPTTGTVAVRVYDALGRLIATAHEGAMEAGAHRVTLPVTALAAGAYVVRVDAGGETISRRLTVVR